MAVELSPGLVAFLRQQISSIEALEVLLLTHRFPHRVWDADSVAAELRIQSRSAAARLAALEKSGLVRIDGASSYRFAADGELAPRVAELDAAYQTHRVRIIELIFSKPADNIRVFADAFVFGKGAKDDD